MAQSSLRPPPYLQPRPKAVPTFSSASIAAKSAPSTPQLSTPSTQSRQNSPARLSGTTDASDKATAALIRRVLCPTSYSGDSRPLDELLPPLTSSNEVDVQLYAIIAIVVKDLVYSWYGKITPDQTFVEEVLKIVAHCTTQLESRLRRLDHESLVLDEIPGLIERHVNGMSKPYRDSMIKLLTCIIAYRVSHQTVNITCLPTDSRVVYHDLNPHPALSPVPLSGIPTTIDEQLHNEADYRQLLVQGALAVLLPTEDLENACLRTLVADVIAESILGNAIGGKVSDGWFIWSGISKLVEVVKAKVHPTATGEAIKQDTRGRLEKFGLLSGKEEKTQTGKRQRAHRSSISSWFWMGLQYIYLTAMTIRFVVVGFFHAHSQPLRSSATSKPTASPATSPMENILHADLSARRDRCRPLLGFRIFPLLSTLLDLPSRSPWLAGSLALVQHHLIQGPFRVAATDGVLDQ